MLALRVTMVFLNFVNYKMINMLELIMDKFCKITIRNALSLKRGSTTLER